MQDRAIVWQGVKRLAAQPVAGLGSYMVFLVETVKQAFHPPFRTALFFRQLEFVGNRSMGIVFMAALMVGAVFGFQLGEIFRIFGAEAMLGAATGFTMAKELGPVLAGILVAGRAGSSMAAEIGTMRVNEQIDAMRVMAVNPYSYLVVPRILATMIMVPLLDAILVVTGVAASFLVGYYFYNVDIGVFFEQMQWICKPRHIWEGMEKAVIFGLILSSVSCYKGFHASGGAKGVGRATTQAVVYSLVAILLSDFFVTYVQYIMR
jgi:phospholipid/cholesterol/gamma-HCH transport system permease protein